MSSLLVLVFSWDLNIWYIVHVLFILFSAIKLIFGNKKNSSPNLESRELRLQSQMETITACHVAFAHIVPFSSNSQMSFILLQFCQCFQIKMCPHPQNISPALPATFTFLPNRSVTCPSTAGRAPDLVLITLMSE